MVTLSPRNSLLVALLAMLVSVSACDPDVAEDETGTGTDTHAETGDDCENDPHGEWDPDAAPPESCEGVGLSLLPGVCIWFPAEGHSWSLAEAAQGIEIPYWVIVEYDVHSFVPQPQDEGACDTPDDSGLILFERLSGDGALYCECDNGFCGTPAADPVLIPKGQTRGTFTWNGLSWTGYSDTSEPYGPPFAAGTYMLEVSAVGMILDRNYAVLNNFEVVLTEE
jgi:hypothetical protein